MRLPYEKVVLTSDSAAHMEGRVVLGPFNTSSDEARESLRRLAALDVEAAGFGHGDPITEKATDGLASWTDIFA